MKRVGRWAAIVFLALTALAGLSNGVTEVGHHETLLQATVQYGDILWGVFGLLAAIGIWRRRPWAVTVTIAWAVSVTYTATIASFAFHDPAFAQEGTALGTTAAGVCTAAVTLLLIWAARVAIRKPDAAPTTPV